MPGLEPALVYDQTLVQYLNAQSPPEIVLIGEPVFRLREKLISATAGSTDSVVLESVSIEAFLKTDSAAQSNVADRVMCLHLPDNATKPQTLLGQACRMSPRLLLVEHTQSSADNHLLEDEQFFALGFRRIEEDTYNTGLQCKLFCYRLSDYKQAPTWLNARFWANPERFDLQD